MRKIGGNGPYRHVYPGQEANLYAQLMKAGMTIEKFNEYWDRIEQQNQDRKISQNEKNAPYRQEVSRRITNILQEKTSNLDNAPHNTFVPTFAPQYADMLKRGGTPGTSLEDPTRNGVWVPIHWIQSRPMTTQSTQS